MISNQRLDFIFFKRTFKNPEITQQVNNALTFREFELLRKAKKFKISITP